MSARRRSINRSYRGRRRGSTVLKFLVAALAVALAAGVLFLLLVPKEYTEDGVKLRLPWTLEEKPADTGPIDPSALIVAESPSPSPSPAPAARWNSALEVSAEDITGGSARDLALQAGADALVVTVKDSEGNLSWHSQVPLALDTMNGSPEFGQAVSGLAEDGSLHLIARLPAFRDLWASVYDRELAVTTAGGELWYDSGGISWLTPSREEARDYLASLCLELARLGFDEILLEHAGYPDQGRLTAIGQGTRYPDPAEREQVVSAFLADLSRQLEQAGAVLSVLVSNGEITSPAPDSGVSLQALAELSGRIWTGGEGDLTALDQALAGAGLDDPEQRLVLTGALPQQAGWTGATARLLS